MATRTRVTPFYAIAGAGDLAVEKLRAVGEDVTARIAKIDQKTLQAELTKAQAGLSKRQAEIAQRIEKRFETIVADARTAPVKLRELPKTAQVNLTTVLGQAEETYEELAGRGKELVERIRHQKATEDLAATAQSTKSKAKATRTTTKQSADTAAGDVKGTATSARKTAKKTASKPAGDATDKIGD